MKRHPKHSRAGFTLFELMAVMFIIGLIMAVAVPQLMPAIMYSEHQGAARHLSTYGRAVIAQATMMHEDLTVRFDLDEQELYTVRWLPPLTEETEGEADVDPAMQEDQLDLFEEARRNSDLSPQEWSEKLADGDLGDMGENFDPEALDVQMNDRFNLFARRALLARAKNVVHEEDILDGVDIFDSQDLDLDKEDEPEEEEIFDHVLSRVRFRGDIQIESVEVDGENSSSGVVEVGLTSLGLDSEVRIFVSNPDREYFTVTWDPISGTTNIFEGHEDQES